MPEKYHVIGLMSGTSMDGLDIAYCEIIKTDSKWTFSFIHTQTIDYPLNWKTALSQARHFTSNELQLLDTEYGRFLGECVVDFVKENGISKVDFVSSHGHTVFHQPERGYTLQIGDGKSIRNSSGFPVVCDFRSQDVDLGGQGAPLVPIGDRLLFSEYDACINLGGFANISFELNMKRLAFDICPVNVALNALANKLELNFDENGNVARSGRLLPDLLQKLNSLAFYSQSIPKSLGIEWVEKMIFPLFEPSYSTEDVLHTFSNHVVQQIRSVVDMYELKTILVTGGGAYNGFIMNQLQKNEGVEFVLPDCQIIEFKEALIFAFLGVLRWRGEINVLQSVTGASKDHSSGKIFE